MDGSRFLQACYGRRCKSSEVFIRKLKQPLQKSINTLLLAVVHFNGMTSLDRREAVLWFLS